MAFWILLHHHKHGVSPHLMWQSGRAPSDQEQWDELDDEGFDAEDSKELVGPYGMPVEVLDALATATTSHKEALDAFDTLTQVLEDEGG